MVEVNPLLEVCGIIISPTTNPCALLVVNVVVVVPAIVVIVAVGAPLVKPFDTKLVIKVINEPICVASRLEPTYPLVVGSTCVTVPCNGLPTAVPVTTDCASVLT